MENHLFLEKILKQNILFSLKKKSFIFTLKKSFQIGKLNENKENDENYLNQNLIFYDKLPISIDFKNNNKYFKLITKYFVFNEIFIGTVETPISKLIKR